MTVTELENGQKAIDALVEKRAKDNSLSDDNAAPIYDGVADEAAYLNSVQKVVWLLLEPYDDGNNGGGGWSLPKDVFLNPKPGDFINPTQQTIAYAMWCARNRKSFAEVPSPEVVYPELQSTGWVNISKMPAKTRSNVPQVIKKYKTYWKDLVEKQIELLAPTVVVIAGQHFNTICDKGVFDGDRGCERTFPETNGLVDYHPCKNFDVLYAYHPAFWNNQFKNCHRPSLTQESYVNSIAQALIFLERKHSQILPTE